MSGDAKARSAGRLRSHIGLVGMALARDWRTTLLLGAVVAHAALIHTVVGSMHRHRLYLMPVFILYTGFLLTRRRRERRALETPRRLGLEWRAFGKPPEFAEERAAGAAAPAQRGKVTLSWV